MAQQQRDLELKVDQVAVRGYIEAINDEYQSGNKQKKTKLLDVSERVLKLHRKHLIRRLNFKQFENIENFHIERRGRPRKYDYEALKPHISYLWNQMERVCSKRMKEALMMNDIYQNYWNPLQNFFLPTMKMTEKLRVGAKIKKVYDNPKTPYQRLLQTGELSEEDQKVLIERKSKLNPFQLKQGLEIKLQEFFEIVKQQHSGRKAA